MVDRAGITRLGEGLEERGEIGSEAVERTVTAIIGMVEEAKRNGVLALAAVGTAGLRIARNSAQVIGTLQARTGVAIEVISPEEEGRVAPDLLVGMGGGVTNMAAVKHAMKVYDPDIVLDRAEIDRQIELYRSRNAAQRRAATKARGGYPGGRLYRQEHNG